MLKKNFLRCIFSAENQGRYKIIKVLGLKFSFTRNLYNSLHLAKAPVQKNKIVFSNYFGKSYGCNPKYITQEIIKQKLPYEIVWLVENPETERKNFPPEVILKPYYSKDAMKELASAGVWVDNTRKKYFWEFGLKKKEEQLYIQTWHGSLGIKKIEGDIENEDQSWREWAKIDSQNIDLVISNSKFEDEIFNRAFWYSGKILRVGHPRNDIFFCSNENKIKIKNKVLKFLNLSPEFKTILYVPTFRDGGESDCFNIDSSKIVEAVQNKFGGNYKFLLRLHPYTPCGVKEFFKADCTVDATSYPDIQELLMAADIVITDYSSIMFDFMLTEKPVFIYARDIEKYNNDRGFYYSLESTPFSISVNNEELVSNIQKFDKEQYIEKVKKFLSKFECIDDGHASERVVKIIKDYIEG